MTWHETDRDVAAERDILTKFCREYGFKFRRRPEGSQLDAEIYDPRVDKIRFVAEVRDRPGFFDEWDSVFLSISKIAALQSAVDTSFMDYGYEVSGLFIVRLSGVIHFIDVHDMGGRKFGWFNRAHKGTGQKNDIVAHIDKKRFRKLDGRSAVVDP